MNKVLITGGAGFIGLHLAKNLVEKGFEVDIVDNFSRGKKDEELIKLARNGRVKLIEKNLLVPKVYDNFAPEYQFIFHLPAIVGVQNVVEKSYDVLTMNVEMLCTTLNFAAINDQLKRFVFASTSEVYAGTLQYHDLKIPTPERTFLTITELESPRTSYMLSKIYGEALCQHSGVPFTIIRPHNVYGPRMGMSHVIPQLLSKALMAKDDFLEVYSPSHTRTFCYIDDAVELIARAAEAELQDITLNVGSIDKEISIATLARMIIEEVNPSLKIKEMTDTEGSPVRRCPDMRHAIDITGYTPQIAIADGLKKTIEWYKCNYSDLSDA
jgi:nucleoside-diphosphate-sugar epimerase